MRRYPTYSSMKHKHKSNDDLLSAGSNSSVNVSSSCSNNWRQPTSSVSLNLQQHQQSLANLRHTTQTLRNSSSRLQLVTSNSQPMTSASSICSIPGSSPSMVVSGSQMMISQGVSVSGMNSFGGSGSSNISTGGSRLCEHSASSTSSISSHSQRANQNTAGEETSIWSDIYGLIFINCSRMRNNYCKCVTFSRTSLSD